MTSKNSLFKHSTIFEAGDASCFFWVWILWYLVLFKVIRFIIYHYKKYCILTVSDSSSTLKYPLNIDFSLFLLLKNNTLAQQDHPKSKTPTHSWIGFKKSQTTKTSNTDHLEDELRGFHPHLFQPWSSAIWKGSHVARSWKGDLLIIIMVITHLQVMGAHPPSRHHIWNPRCPILKRDSKKYNNHHGFF